MKTIYVKIVTIFFFICFGVDRLAAEDLNGRLSVSLDSDSTLEAKSNYLSFFMLQIQDTETSALSSRYELIEPTTKAIDFDMATFNGNWTGIFPDVDFSLPSKNFTASSFKLSSIDSSKWNNSNILIKSASISALGRKYASGKGVDKDDIVLIIYNLLNMATSSAEALGDVAGIGDTSKLKNSIGILADKVSKYQDNMQELALYMGILKVSLNQVNALIDITGSDDPTLIEIQNFTKVVSTVMDKLVELQGTTISNTQEYEEYSQFILEERYKKLLEAAGETVGDTTLNSLNQQFKTLYDNSTDTDKVKLVARYCVEPLSSLLGAYELKLQKDLTDATSTSNKKQIQAEINFLKNGRAVLLLATLFVASDEYITMAKEHPKELISFFINLSQEVVNSLYTIDKTTAVASKIISKYSVIGKKMVGKGNAFMKAFVAGSEIGNTMLPMIWDMTLAPSQFIFSIKDGRISKYGTTSSKVVVKSVTDSTETTLKVFINELNKQNGVVEVASGTRIRVLSDVTQEALFDNDRAPWIVSAPVSPAPIYDIITTTPSGYTDDYLCLRKPPFYDTDFAVHSQSGENYTAVSGLCGSGTWLGDGWYDTTATSTQYDLDTLPQKYELKDLATETEADSSFLSSNEFVYDGNVTTLLVQIHGNYVNTIVHRITVVPFVTIPESSISISSQEQMSVDINLTAIESSQEDPITEYAVDWGDGTSETTSVVQELTHTYSVDGNYEITLRITTTNGLQKEITKQLNISSDTPPTAQNQNISVDENSSNNAITLVGSDADGDTLTYKLLSQPANGTLSGTVPNLNYTPTAGYTGTDSFTFSVSDATTESESATVNITVNALQAASKSLIKKTGQTKSYDENGTEVTDGSLRDDGYYQKGVTPDYTRASDIVTDELTGLMWQDDAAVASVTKQWLTDDNYNTCKNDTSSPACYDTSGDTAATYCSELNLGGYTDWRLPTSTELEGIVDYGKYSPAIDTTYFNNVSSGSYWSSITYEYYAWYVYFGYGGVNYDYKDDNIYVRCVRDGQ